MTSNQTKLTLREMRESRKRSAASVARLCDATSFSIHAWERGDVVPNIVVVAKMLDLYEYKLEDLDMTMYYAKIDERTAKRDGMSINSKNENAIHA